MNSNHLCLRACAPGTDTAQNSPHFQLLLNDQGSWHFRQIPQIYDQLKVKRNFCIIFLLLKFHVLYSHLVDLLMSQEEAQSKFSCSFFLVPNSIHMSYKIE